MAGPWNHFQPNASQRKSLPGYLDLSASLARLVPLLCSHHSLLIGYLKNSFSLGCGPKKVSFILPDACQMEGIQYLLND